MRRDSLSVPWCLFESRRLHSLHPGCMAVLVLCYGVADKQGRGHWPTNLIQPGGMTREDVQRAFAELVRLGLVDILQTFGADEAGGVLKSGYRLPVSRSKNPGPCRLPGFVWRLTVHG